jgi:hypothetical protein
MCRFKPTATKGLGLRRPIDYNPQNTSIFRGSSINSFTVLRNVTASRPSTSLWSYVKAIWYELQLAGAVPKYIIGRMTICPFTATGRSFVACRPRTAVCGKLMIGVP